MKKKNKGMDKSTKIMFWIIGVIFVFFIALIFVSKQSDTNDVKKNVAIDYTNQPFIGEQSAPVQIVEFGDYKCPICKQFNDATVPLIKKELVDTGKAKFYFFNDSFINIDSIRSAKFAETVYHELGNDTFWKFHELLYKKQPEGSKYETKDVYTEAFLEDMLNEIVSKADTEKVMKAFQEKKYDKAWDKDMSYVKKFGITGTPTILVNGKQFKGNSLKELVKMVDDAAAEGK